MLCILWFCLSFSGFGQNEQLAKNYTKKGEYKKALIIYQKLYKAQAHKTSYFLSIIATQQELENYKAVDSMLFEKLAASKNHPEYLVELGHNYDLQQKKIQAQDYYSKALNAIETNARFTYRVAFTFNKYTLLDYAIKAYKRGMELNENLNFNSHLARIYGEQGEFEAMFESVLSLVDNNPAYANTATRTFNQFVNDDPENEANIILKKILLKKVQIQPNLLYNTLLSWLFVQQKEFIKAFTQEKAIYKRSDENLDRIFELADITYEAKQYVQAKKILDYIIKTSLIEEQQLEAHQLLMTINVKISSKEQYPDLEKQFKDLIQQFGTGLKTRVLQIDYNHFLAFMADKKPEAIANLKRLLKEPLSRYDEARVKMKLADILVISEQYNQALIYYTQIQKKIKNHVLSQEARFKVAKTCYYKGDFSWAEIQLNVLKRSTSQLIANDAMALSLLISDHSFEDSTQTALKLYAHADLLMFQQKDKEAIETLDKILVQHKGESIEDEALLKQAQLFERNTDFEKAEANYKKIIEFYADKILADDAYFKLAELYNNQLQQPEKAKPLYEYIIFNHPDSIYFVDARKKYRSLRGESIN